MCVTCGQDDSDSSSDDDSSDDEGGFGGRTTNRDGTLSSASAQVRRGGAPPFCCTAPVRAPHSSGSHSFLLCCCCRRSSARAPGPASGAALPALDGSCTVCAAAAHSPGVGTNLTYRCCHCRNWRRSCGCSRRCPRGRPRGGLGAGRPRWRASGSRWGGTQGPVALCAWPGGCMPANMKHVAAGACPCNMLPCWQRAG